MEETTGASLWIQNHEAYKTPFCTKSALFGGYVLLLRILDCRYVMVRANNL